MYSKTKRAVSTRDVEMVSTVGEEASKKALAAIFAESKRNPRKTIVKKNYWICDPFKRIYAQLPLGFLVLNTIQAINNIAASVSSVPATGFVYDDDDAHGTYITDNDGYYECVTGKSLRPVEVACPYATTTVYQVLLFIWIAYFCSVFLCKYLWTFKYSTNDMRFFIATDQFNVTWVGFFIKLIGFVLTSLTVLIVIIIVPILYGSDIEFDYASLVTFGLANMISLQNLFVANLDCVKDLDLHFTFPDEILIEFPPDMANIFNLYGVLLGHSVIFHSLFHAHTMMTASGDFSRLTSFGDIVALNRVVRILYDLDGKNDDRRAAAASAADDTVASSPNSGSISL